MILSTVGEKLKMDIFTTQLIRVFGLPIKPTNLKVNAPKKESANTKLSQDPDHLENHNTYFNDEEHFLLKESNKIKMQQPDILVNANSVENINNKCHEDDIDTLPTVDKKVTKHLDLYA